MANNFSTDPNCKAVWRFESGALTTDSKGANTLADYNTVVADTVTFNEGLASARFNGTNALYLTQANMAADFPIKAGVGGIFTICVRFLFNAGKNTNYQSLFNTSYWASYGGVQGGFRTDGKFYLQNIYGPSSYDGNGIFTPVAGNWYWLYLSINQLTKQWVWYVWNLTSNSLLGNGTWSSFYTPIIANTHALTIGGSGSPSDPSVSPGWDGYIDEFVVFDRALLSAEIALILPQTFPVGLPALLDSDSAMAGAAYYPPSNVQSNAAHIMAAYSLTPMESYAQASNAHMMAAYSVNKSPVRVFPVNPPQRPSQSQGWKRTFPI